ncbi:hypothetical protein MMC22_009413 [Lobaria immixta]|nr:hypothetical protein [Lobaria immixta]
MVRRVLPLALSVHVEFTNVRIWSFTIFANRITLVACCILWLFLFSTPRDALKKVMFTIIMSLGMVEKASRTTNILSKEIDWVWVPILANANRKNYGLTHMNTIMRRMDLVYKFVVPLVISSLVALVKPALALVTTAAVGSVSVAMNGG